MDALLPSEIARLVLGYLQENNCQEVAKMFLETSPHLQECRLVAQKGGRYGTKVGGLNLIDMLDKYCAANSIIQDKLTKISDSEHIKNCNDIAEQLRYLLEGSRGHRFVVNINVPTQNSPNGTFGTPTLSASSRKRQHSGSDRGKRVVKSLNNALEKDIQSSTGQSCDTVEATPLESLPGHNPITKNLRTERYAKSKSSSKLDSIQNCSNDNRFNVFTSVDTQSDLNVMQNTGKSQSIETILTSNITQTPNKCIAETSSYCNTQMQPTPLDLFDTEHDINYEPIANLSILTEELLNRTELAQQIAENINKSIIPIQENSDEKSDANLSLLQGFDNAVKSAVETTDKDLEGFFNELFAVADTDTNQDKNSNEKNSQEIKNAVYNENMESIDIDHSFQLTSSQVGQQTKKPEVPLKQRLRNSSRTQINPDEDERDSNTLLDNQNEEAIRNIVANAMASKQSSKDERELTPENTSPNNIQLLDPTVEIPSTGNENVEPNKNASSAKPTKPRKYARKPRGPKQKTDRIEAKAEEIKMQEQNMMTMPTLILCTETDMPPNSIAPMKPGYVPIAPKPSKTSGLTALQDRPAVEGAPPKIFLRTVNVPRHLVKPSQLEASTAANQLIMQLQASPQKPNATTPTCCGSPIVVPIVITDEKQRQQQQQQLGSGEQPAESITLYGDDSSSEMRVPAPVASLPLISLDESACSFTGTGLSPFFKANINAEPPTQMNENQHKTIHSEDAVVALKLTQASNNEVQPEQYTQNDDVEQSEDNRGGNAKEMVNPTVVITEPSEDEAIINDNCKAPEQAAEDIKPKSADVNKEKKESDEVVVSKNEYKVNEQSIVAEKEKTNEKNYATFKEKVIPAMKDNKSEEKAEPANKDRALEGKPAIVKKDSKVGEKANESMRRVDVLIAKRTPKSLMKDRSKNNRLSLSTPRRRHSHVRALDFDEKTPEHKANTRKVPQSCTRPKSNAVQGLFQSPPFSGETPPVNLTDPIADSQPVKTHVSVPPIATRSPAPKLQGNWNKVAGIGTILGDTESSPEKTRATSNPSTVVEEKEPPKSWDSDLRKIVGEVSEEDDKRPKSAKKSRRRYSIRGKTIEEVQQPRSAKKSLNKTPTPGIIQEYVKMTPPPASLKPKINVQQKTSPELLARFRDLQTPLKVDALTVPSTPRITFATPGARIVKITSGTELVIKDGINTPDFPPTPSITHTPKIIDEEDHGKKPSPYYEPSEDTAQKETQVSEKIVVQQVTTTVAIQKKNVVDLQESKTVEMTKFDTCEAETEQIKIKEVESTSEDNSKEIIEEESMEDTNASMDTTNTDSESDSNSDSNSSTSSSSSNSSSSGSSSCSSSASSPMKSINVSHYNNSATESEVDSPLKIVNDLKPINEEPASVVESVPEKQSSSAKVVVPTAPQVLQLTSTISAIITNEKRISKIPPKPKIINVQTISPSSTISLRELEEKRLRVLAKFKQTASTKRTVTVKRVTAAKRAETKPPAKKVVKPAAVKKIKPTPKKKVGELNNEVIKPQKVVETQKENVETKVDQVKRDLLAPETDEAEQRTTRSQSARKSVDENPPLPGVLECLQLIPANKSSEELLDQSVDGLSNSQTNSLEVSFVYDDSVPIKKRKRNYSSSELENEYAFTFPDEDEVRIMKVQPYEEIFKMAPKPTKKKTPKKSPIKAKRKLTKGPLAASSPIKKVKLQRNIAKRKASPIKEGKEAEKKPKIEEKVPLDPQALFKKIDVDKFLKAVHVSK